jgi:predicted nucleic acid-binding protein
MPSDGVVADTSPLLNLALIDRVDLLEQQFSGITAPEQVWTELSEGEDGLDALRALRESGFLTVVPVERSDLFVEIVHELDLGETAAICYAVESDADLLLIDEREGRRVARRHGLSVTGVVGVLLREAKQGALDIEAELDALREAGFWLSDDLRDDIIAAAADES